MSFLADAALEALEAPFHIALEVTPHGFKAWGSRELADGERYTAHELVSFDAYLSGTANLVGHAVATVRRRLEELAP